jgi:hypothetical protein
MPVSRLSCQTTRIGHNDTLPEPWMQQRAMSDRKGMLPLMSPTAPDVETRDEST